MKQKLITDYFDNSTNKKVKIDSNNDKKIYGYNPKTESWHCVLCGSDMGINNPRQLCGKSYCYNS